MREHTVGAMRWVVSAAVVACAAALGAALERELGAAQWDAALADAQRCLSSARACVRATPLGLVRAETREECEAQGGEWHEPLSSGAALAAASGAALSLLSQHGESGPFLVRWDGAPAALSAAAASAGGELLDWIPCGASALAVVDLLPARAPELAGLAAGGLVVAMPAELRTSALLSSYEAGERRAGRNPLRRLRVVPSARARVAALGQRRGLETAASGAAVSAAPGALLSVEDQDTVTVVAPSPGSSAGLRSSDGGAADESAGAADGTLMRGAALVEPKLRMYVRNYESSLLVQSGVSFDAGGTFPNKDNQALLWSMGITGAGQVVGVADTGLDTQSCFFRDPNVNELNNKNDRNLTATNLAQGQGRSFDYPTHRKVVQYTVVSGVDGDEAVNAGHGTHVCGSIAGLPSGTADDNRDGVGLNPIGIGATELLASKGVAYGARIAFWDIGVPNSKNLLAPQIQTILQHQYSKAGARIFSNSWGSESVAYDSEAVGVDNFMFTNQDALVLLAAGNDGFRGAGGTVGSPATAKNSIAVAASINTANSWAHTSSRVCPNTFCHNSLAEFSSSGPMADGRTKPDLAAPGSLILSARSSGQALQTCSVVLLQGTSMATPVMAGLATLVRQYFVDGYFPSGIKTATAAFNPMGALVKAMLVNGADKLTGMYGNINLANFGVPNAMQGYGRVHASNTVPPPGNNPQVSGVSLVVDGDMANKPTLSVEGQSKTYSVTLKQNQGFKATLAWSDAPASTLASKSIMNDLDLTVTGPDGTVFFPNGRSSKDDLNSVEHVELRLPVQAGTYTVTVRLARKSSVAAQPFAVVLSTSQVANAPTATPGTFPPTAPTTRAPTSATTITVPTPPRFPTTAAPGGASDNVFEQYKTFFIIGGAVVGLFALVACVVLCFVCARPRATQAAPKHTEAQMVPLGVPAI
jgi:hypothetical protein